MQRWIQRDVGLLSNPKTWRLGRGRDALVRVVLYEELLALSMLGERGGLLRPGDVEARALSGRLAIFEVQADEIPGHLDALAQAGFVERQEDGCWAISGWDDVYPSWGTNGKHKPTSRVQKAICPVCSETFSVNPRHTKQRYCSTRCRVRAHRDPTALQTSLQPLRRNAVLRGVTLRRNEDVTRCESTQVPANTEPVTPSLRGVTACNGGEEKRIKSTLPPTSPPTSLQPEARNPEASVGTALLAVGVHPGIASELTELLGYRCSPEDIQTLAQLARRQSASHDRSAGLLVTWLRSGTWEEQLAGIQRRADVDECSNGAGRVWGWNGPLSPDQESDWKRRMRAQEADDARA